MRVVRPRCPWAAALLLALLAFGVSPASAQGPAIPNGKALERAVGKEDYAEARRVAEAIFRQGTPPDRQKASLVYGRILLALGQKDEARRYLAALAKPGNDTTGGQLTAVYGAWFKALDGKSDEAIRALEKLLEENAQTMATAEAADVLAMLYLTRGEKDKAKKTVAAGLKLVEYLALQDPAVKGGYVGVLLRGRLASSVGQGEAKRLFEAAEKLRGEGKFLEAGRLYTQLRMAYPKTEWAHAAGFHLGQCYVGIDRPAQAADHWRKFIADAPSGPWRGQARVALVDRALASLPLDLPEATEHAMAAAAALHKPLDPAAAPSWQTAAYDIHLRHGLVSLIDGRFAAAAEALADAKKVAPQKNSSEVLAGLDRLVDAAQHRASLIPDELTTLDRYTAAALALGNAYHHLHDFDRARQCFGRFLSGPTRSSSAPCRSFAHLGLARVLMASPVKVLRSHGDQTNMAGKGKAPSRDKARNVQARDVRTPPGLAQAADAYNAALKEYPRGSWHDETLRGLALLTERSAAERFPAPALQPGDEEKGRKERLAALRKARSEALPYWQRILDDHPQSPRCEDALYHAGVLLYEKAEDLPVEKSKPTWKEATALFQRLCQQYPKSPYLGDTYVRQIDMALERMFDLELAASLADQGLQWAKDQDIQVTTRADGHLTEEALGAAAEAIDVASLSLAAWARTDVKRADALLDDLYNLYLRVGIVAYVQEDFERAHQYFDAAGPARPVDGMEARFDRQKIGLHILKVSCKRDEHSWDPEVLKVAKTDRQKLALKLAGTYLHAVRPAKAEAIYEEILSPNSSLGRPSKAIEAFCLMQLAMAYSDQRINHEISIEYYRRFYEKDYADLPWAADAIMLLAVLEFNTTQDPRRAIPHLQHILANYPNHREAERALYLLALDAVLLCDKALAERSCREYLGRYAREGWKNSGWRDHVARVLRDDVPKLQDKEQKR